MVVNSIVCDAWVKNGTSFVSSIPVICKKVQYFEKSI